MWISVPLSAYACVRAVLKNFLTLFSVNIALWGWLGCGEGSGKCRVSGIRNTLRDSSKECCFRIGL